MAQKLALICIFSTTIPQIFSKFVIKLFHLFLRACLNFLQAYFETCVSMMPARFLMQD